ncbi:MAG: cytochrome c [Geothrix sp.]|nr:cytochrome c [Geothrix sp.]
MRMVSFLPALLAAGALGAQGAPVKTVDDLRAFFAQNCVKCHGADGSALGPEGKKLGGRDFTDAKRMAADQDADLVKAIRKGLFFGMVMPSFKGQLSEEEAGLLVREVLRKAEKGKAIVPVGGAAR